MDHGNYLNSLYYRKTVGLQVSNLWGMMYKKGDYAIVHDHWPALWSGVFYMKVPEKSGELFFPQLKQTIMPNENQLIIFNGSTRHGVKESFSDEKRICVSFNVKEDISA